MNRHTRSLIIAVCSLLAGTIGLRTAASATPEVLYGTAFEPSEGYTPATNEAQLVGQLGWMGEGSGGNGFVTNFFEGFGQQAFIGYEPPALKHDTLTIWRPFDPPQITTNRPVVRFSVLMQIEDSTSANGNYDEFRWSAYNTESKRLFSISFDNYDGQIYYSLDGTNTFQASGFEFSNTAIYYLDVYMNLVRNNWTALLNGFVIIDSQPITTTGAKLDLSDFDAVWLLRTKGQAGDNYMLFDEYFVTHELDPSIPPQLELIGMGTDGKFEMIVHGERGLPYAIDVSEDLQRWEQLSTNTPADGFWHFVDDTSNQYRVSFYRVRQVKQ